MARLHSKKKGKSGTRRPKSALLPKWVLQKPEEIKEIIVKMAKEGTPTAKIGLILRDRYAIPSVNNLIGMSLQKFLKQEKLLPEYPEDIVSLIRKAVRVREHLKIRKKDTLNRVKLLHIESKIHRLSKYYIKKGRMAQSWKYNPEQAALLVK